MCYNINSLVELIALLLIGAVIVLLILTVAMRLCSREGRFTAIISACGGNALW